MQYQEDVSFFPFPSSWTSLDCLKSLAHYIFAPALENYAPRVLDLVDQLAACIGAHNGKPVNVNDVMSWFSFDAMGEFTFGEDFGMMRSSKWHPAIWRQQRALALLAPFNDTIWLVRAAFAFVPFLGKVRDWFSMVSFCEERMEKRMKAFLFGLLNRNN